MTLDQLAEAGLIDPGWDRRFPDPANPYPPYTSTIVFAVRRGNPFGVKDWDDLPRLPDGASVVTANPKTSGAAKLGLLACWGAVTTRGGSDRCPRQRSNESNSASRTCRLAGSGRRWYRRRNARIAGRPSNRPVRASLYPAPAGVSALYSVNFSSRSETKNESSRAVGLGSGMPGSAANSRSSAALSPN